MSARFVTAEVLMLAAAPVTVFAGLGIGLVLIGVGYALGVADLVARGARR